MKPFSLIVAIDQKRGIGKKGQLPWALPGDMQHFKDVTLATTAKGHVNAVVMGRRTWESIPAKFRPLPQRLNVVLTNNQRYELPQDVVKASSLEEALVFLSAHEKQKKIDHVFIIGGASVYAEALAHPLCQKIHLTILEGDFSCDTFFPAFEKDFRQVECSPPCCEKGITYRFYLYERQ